MRRLLLPLGLVLFLAGIIYAGLPPDMLISWGIDFDIDPGTLQAAGIALFIAGAILMILGSRGKRTKHGLEDIKRTIGERRR